MTSLSRLKVYATHPHPCSYLEEQQATTLFVDPDTEVDPYVYQELADIGFRRSGSHIYRPHCASCNACIPARVAVATFSQKRQQRKNWNRNQDLHVEQVTSIDDPIYYDLYERYISERHADGDMYPANKDQYDSFLTDNGGMTQFFGFWLQQQLVAVAVVDVMPAGLSAIYTFYEPGMDRRSLGRFAILWQIEHARTLGLPHVYLGYWIKQCQKMSYKIDYRPVELLINSRWLTLS